MDLYLHEDLSARARVYVCLTVCAMEVLKKKIKNKMLLSSYSLYNEPRRHASSSPAGKDWIFFHMGEES